MARRRPITALAKAPAASPSLARHAPGPINPAVVYLANLSKGSRPAQESALWALASILSPKGDIQPPSAIKWGALRYEHTSAIRQKLKDRYAPATANRHISALRGVLKHAWRLGQIPAEEYQRAIDLDPVRGARVLAGRALDQRELTSIFHAAHDELGTIGVRDEAILAVLYGGGLRRSEVVSTDLNRYDRRRGVLTVLGKGNKEREVPIPESAARKLTAWLKVRGNEPGPLFCRYKRNGPVFKRLSVSGVSCIMRRVVKASGLQNTTPHDLRRSYITDALDNSDSLAVSEVVGHSDPKTTKKYDRRGERGRRAVADHIHVPE